MSEAAPTKIEPTLVLDPRLTYKASGSRRFGVQRGGALNTWRPITTSTASNGQITWQNCNPPAPSVALGRQVLAIVGFDIQITGTQTGTDNFYLPDQGYSCPRYAPLAQVTNNVAINLNGTNFTQNNYQIINAQAHYLSNDASVSNSSLWPDMPDAAWKYGLFNDNLIGTVGNPLSSYGNSTAHQITRGSFPVIVANTGNDATHAHLQFYTCEPLFLSPFEINQQEPDGALIGVQQFTVSINLQNLLRVWSWDAETAALDNNREITSMVVNVIANPTLMLNFITPEPTAVIPKSVSYTFKGVTVYETGPFAIAPGATQTCTTGNVQFNFIPDRIMVFARIQDTDLNSTSGNNANAYSLSDYFAAIDGISITWDNRSGILAEALPQALYQIAQKNGYNKSWQAWTKFLGSVLMLNMSEDVCLNSPAEAPSLQTTKQFQLTATLRNLNLDDTVNYTIYVVTISDGLMSVGNNTMIVQQSILTPQDILDATTHATKVEPRISAGNNFLGGNFTESLKKFAHKVNKALKDTHAISQVANAAGYENVGKFAHSQGYGLVGGARLKKKHLALKN